jgi:ABC-type antimicrobial peptide transport system permease subunit
VRTSADPRLLVAALRDEVKSIDASLSVLNIETLAERVHQSLGGERNQATLLGTFGLLALLLASIGLYGVMAYSVAQRTREIGIRMALGAERRDVLSLVLKQGIALTGIGIVVGLGVAFGATRLIASSLFGVSALDPVTFAATSGVLIVVALVASLIPARRATRIDPMIALRYE